MAYSSLNNLPLEWIRAFEAAGRTGSFTAAANETGLTQAAISLRISNLEQHIGVSLFIRKARGVTLSVDGEAWLPYVSSALHDLEQSYDGLFGSDRSRITISASASIVELWLASRLKDWDISTQTQISFSTMVLQADKSQHNTTVRIRYGSGDWPEHYKTPLFREEIAPVASAAHFGKSKNKWHDIPRVAVSGPRPGWQEWVNQTGDPATPVPKVRFDSFSAALCAVIAGAGVSLASIPLCRQALNKKILVRISKDALMPQQTYWMLAHKDKITKRQWDMLVEFFTE